MSEIFDRYNARVETVAIETVKRLTPFKIISNNEIIVASGSPRSSRWVKAFPANLVPVQLSVGQIRRRIYWTKAAYNLFLEAENLVESVEPRGQWTKDDGLEVTDSDLSLQKARRSLFATFLLDINLDKIRETDHFYAIGKDFNVASNNGIFMDKPALIISGPVGHYLPEGEVLEGQDSLLASPQTQHDLLYSCLTPRDMPRPFYIANSSSLIEARVNRRRPPIEEIRQLGKISQALPAWITYNKVLTFMAVRPSKEAVDFVAELIARCNSNTSGYDQQQLYKIPGVVDWSKLQDHLSIFLLNRDGRNYPISENFSDVHSQVEDGSAQEIVFKQALEEFPQIEDELVGASTYALEKLFSSLDN